MKKKPIILGIETSCDETAASIIQENEDENVKFYPTLFRVNLMFTKNLEEWFQNLQQDLM